MGHKAMKSRCKSNLRAFLDSTRLVLEFRKVSVARLILIFAGAIQYYKYYRLIQCWSKYHTGQNTALDNMPYSGQNTALGKYRTGQITAQDINDITIPKTAKPAQQSKPTFTFWV